MSTQNTEQNRNPVMAKEIVMVRFIRENTDSFEGAMLAAMETIQKYGGRIVGPVSIAENSRWGLISALITYAFPIDV